MGAGRAALTAISAANACPVRAAVAANAMAHFFMFKSPVYNFNSVGSIRVPRHDSRNPVRRLYAVHPGMLLRREHTCPKTNRSQAAEKGGVVAQQALKSQGNPSEPDAAGTVVWRPQTSKRSSLANSALSEMKA